MDEAEPAYTGWSERELTAVTDAVRRLPALCGEDGEFGLTARFWTGALWVGIDDELFVAEVESGAVTACDATNGAVPDVAGQFGFVGPLDVWWRLLQPMPEPGFHDIVPAQYAGMRRVGHRDTYWQYFPAARRVIDLLRNEVTRSVSAAGAAQ
jgi:hypothetical protein